MIAYDFDYHLPENVEEAVRTYDDLYKQGKSVLYYGGGTEIISMTRMHNLFVEAVVDIKAIPECNILSVQDGKLIIGSAVTLTRIDESGFFPLLGRAAARVADHTIQGKITLGGHIAGTIIYHEALLPLLLTDSDVVVAGETGRRQVPIEQVFHERNLLKKGEFIVRFVIDQTYLDLPYYHVKKTKVAKIDYPVLTLAALKYNGRVRFGFSGLCDFPFRSQAMEKELNRGDVPLERRIAHSLSHLPAPIRSDLQSSAEYRTLLYQNAVMETFERFGVG